MDLKSTAKHENSIPLPHCTAVRGYGIFHDVSMGLETIWAVGDYLCWTHPLKFHIWTPKGQGWSVVSWWRIWQDNWLVWRSRPYTLYGKPCAFEGQSWSSDHPGSRHCLIHSGLNSPWCNNKSVPALFRPALFQNLIKMWRKTVLEIKRKQCLQWAWVRKFHLILKVGYYHECP